MGFGFLIAFQHAQAASLYSFQVVRSCLCSLYIFFLCLFEFCQDLLVNSCRPSGIFARFPAHWYERFLSLKEVIFEYQPIFLELSSLQGPVLWDSVKQIPESVTLKSRAVILFFYPVPSSQDPECHHCHCNLRLPLTFTSPRSSSLFVSIRSSTVPLIVGSVSLGSGICHQCFPRTLWVVYHCPCWLPADIRVV